MMQKPSAPVMVLLTPKEAAKVLKVSSSWLAKARMQGNGPPFIKIGRAIRRARSSALREASNTSGLRGKRQLSTELPTSTSITLS
jgi:hypothetical protein